VASSARDDGLIGGIGLSNVSLDHLRYALAITDVACVQNLMNLSDRRSMPRPAVLLIPGTSSLSRLEENMSAANVELNAEARNLLA
jgi:aryl-alcohol dehydrogenase-like predicted oxidoreductase